MPFRPTVSRVLSVLCLLALGSAAFADKLILKDGSVLEGRVIKKSDGYWIKLADDSTQTVATADVEKWERASAIPSTPSVTPKPTPVHTPAVDTPSTTVKPKSSLQAVKRRAEAVDVPLAAVTIWQEFIDSKPLADDLKVAQDEMARWKKLHEDGAERIKGKWVSGEERKQILTKVEQLNKEFMELMRANQTLQAVQKLEAAEAIYPNSYWINFWLGFMDMAQNQDDDAVKHFDQALKLRPKIAAAIGNQALILIKKKKLAEGVLKLHEAAEAGDTPEIAVNLNLALSQLPPNQKSGERFKAATKASGLLNTKYASLIGERKFSQFIPIPLNEAPGSAQKHSGGMWSGTGFIVSADGLILTNRHVVEGAKTMMVMLEGNQQKTGEIVMIDDQQDLALVRVKSETPLPFVKLSPHDQPGIGAECTVMGFPLLDRLGANIKITRGVVTGVEAVELNQDVIVDAKVNPGNSGGPILDRHGNVLAIVSMKTLSTTTEDTYGLGLSSGHIRKFLTKNKLTLAPGEEVGANLSSEEIAAKIRPAAVCILSTR